MSLLGIRWRGGLHWVCYEHHMTSTWSTHDNAQIIQWTSGLEYRQIYSGTLEVVDPLWSSLHTDHCTRLAQFSVLLEQSQPLTRVYQRGNTLQWVVEPHSRSQRASILSLATCTVSNKMHSRYIYCYSSMVHCRLLLHCLKTDEG